MKNIANRHERSSISFNRETDRRSSLSLSNHSKSPSKNIKGVRVYNFSNINSYGKITRPFLNQDKYSEIKEKLDLEKEAIGRTKERNKINRHFVQYRFNPFIPEKPTHSKSMVIFYQESQKIEKQHQQEDIVNGIHTMKQKKLHRAKHSASFHQMQRSAVQRSTSTKKQVVNSSKSVRFLQKQMPQLQRQSDPVDTPTTKQPFFKDQMDFQDIISIKEQKYNPDKYKSINIFRLLFDKSQFFGKGDPLDKHYFSFTSMVDKVNRHETHLMRDLSRQARRIVSLKPKGLIPNTVDLLGKQILFQEIMNIAAGRFTPEFVYQQLNQKRIKQQELGSFDFGTKFEEQLNNKSSLIDLKNQDVFQIQNLKKRALQKEQVIYSKLCENRKQEINRLIKKEQSLIRKSIYDRNLHDQIKQEVAQRFKEFVQSDYKHLDNPLEVQKKIARNKEEKRKKQAIKMKQLIGAYLFKKDSDRQTRELFYLKSKRQ